ncbi:MAG: hypothetical protein ACLFSQ_06200 [Candidatus Zixiibacteriota bacterium]
MQEFLREWGIYLVFIMGIIFFALRMLRKKRFAPENPRTDRKKANVLIKDWFSRVDRLLNQPKDTTEDELAELYVLQNKIDDFMEKHRKLALYFDQEAIDEIFEKLGLDIEPSMGNFMKIAGLSDPKTVSHYYREKIDKWIDSIDFPPYFPLELYWEIIKGHYYEYQEDKLYKKSDDLQNKYDNIKRLVRIVDIQLDYKDEQE